MLICAESSEDEEIAKAITISLEEFVITNRKTTEWLLKRNDQLQTQLALKNSRYIALLESAIKMSKECNKSLDLPEEDEEELFICNIQDSIAENEKLKSEPAVLKSQLNALNATRSSNVHYCKSTYS